MSEQSKKINCINISYLFKTSIGSINGSWTEGNVSTVKKITLPSGKTLPYVSGQSLRYQLRRKFEENGETLSPVGRSEKTEGVDVTAGDPINFIDDDLLGFMIASTGENRRRTAAVRTSPCIGVFPFRGDRDMGTKSKESSSGEMSAGGNIFETEEYYNYFKANIFIETDRVGVFRNFELGKDFEKKILNIKELNIVKEKGMTKIDEKLRKLRIEKLFDALKTLWGGGKQSRFLTDMTPKFIIITFQTSKSPLFLEGFSMEEDETLDTKTTKEILKDNEKIIKHTFIGVRNGIFKNDVENELKALELESVTINEAIEKAIEYLNKETTLI